MVEYEATLGVGTVGSGLYVHGSYKSIKAAQAFIFRAEKAEAALRSIAASTCCEGCQEAARVARAALIPSSPEGE